ncbi:MAG: hypothetical protein IIT71_01050 [Acetobacter sp.]|nr:hypothetical protein [Acetobacter sp.]
MKIVIRLTFLCLAVFLMIFHQHESNAQERNLPPKQPYLTGVIIPKPTPKTCSDYYLTHHLKLKKAISVILHSLINKGLMTQKEFDHAVAEGKTGNFKDIDTALALFQPKALRDYLIICEGFNP